MKIPITDEFLWDIYKCLENSGNVVEFMLNPHPAKWNRLSSIQNPIFEKYRKERGRKNFAKLLYYVKRKNYIKVKNLEGKAAIMLTKEGLDKALRASFSIEPKNKRKDGKWIMVIFDIPTKYNKSRNLMTSILRNLGYKMFQQSVWITPYDVSEKTETLLQMYSLDGYVKIFLIEKI